MVNQQKIIPLGRLSGIIVDIDGVRITTDFEVIDIVDDSNPYPTLLGLDWEFDNMAIINLKKRKMIFESNNMRVIVPLDPSEGVRYTQPVREEYNADDINNIYQITKNEEEWINTTADGKWTQGQDSSRTSYSKQELENWQNRMHEVSTRRCARITKVAHCMTAEVSDLPLYDGLGDVNTFFRDYERQVPKCQRLLAMDQALRDTFARWWGTIRRIQEIGKNVGG